MSNLINLATVFIVVPAYNESHTLRMITKQLLNCHYNVVIVDDGSDISLMNIISDLPVHLLTHLVNLGQGAALQTGIEFSLSQNAQYIVTFDADAQHLVSDIEPLLEKLVDADVDIILGSRFIDGASQNMPQKKKFILQIARKIEFLFTGLLLSDAHNGFRVMNREAASLIRITENRMAHATEILSEIKKHNLSYSEAPVHIQYSDYSLQKGQSGWNSFRIFFDLLLNKIFK